MPKKPTTAPRVGTGTGQYDGGMESPPAPIRWLQLRFLLGFVLVVVCTLGAASFIGSDYGIAALLGALAVWVGWNAIMTRRLRKRVADARYFLCPECGYPFAGLPAKGLCPECGSRYDAAELREVWTDRHPEPPPVGLTALDPRHLPPRTSRPPVNRGNQNSPKEAMPWRAPPSDREQ
jgi:hypothetical protein